MRLRLGLGFSVLGFGPRLRLEVRGYRLGYVVREIDVRGRLGLGFRVRVRVTRVRVIRVAVAVAVAVGVRVRVRVVSTSFY